MGRIMLQNTSAISFNVELTDIGLDYRITVLMILQFQPAWLCNWIGTCWKRPCIFALSFNIWTHTFAISQWTKRQFVSHCILTKCGCSLCISGTWNDKGDSQLHYEEGWDTMFMRALGWLRSLWKRQGKAHYLEWNPGCKREGTEEWYVEIS
jgi:hypothetical protein